MQCLGPRLRQLQLGRHLDCERGYHQCKRTVHGTGLCGECHRNRREYAGHRHIGSRHRDRAACNAAE